MRGGEAYGQACGEAVDSQLAVGGLPVVTLSNLPSGEGDNHHK